MLRIMALVVLLVAPANQSLALDDTVGAQTDSSRSATRIAEFIYKPTYFGLRVVDRSTKGELKFQVSIRTSILEPANLYLGYTLKSFWQTGEQSAPFREHNFNPEVFWRVERNHRTNQLKWARLPFIPGALRKISHVADLTKVQIGYEHESTGVATSESRGWDRAYVELRYRYPEIGKTSGRHEVLFYPRLWWVLQESPENDTILDYTSLYFGDDAGRLGGKLILTYTHYYIRPASNGVLAVPLQRVSFQKGASSGVVEFNQRLRLLGWEWNDFYLYVQYFRGKGEGLVDFNKTSESWTIGIALFKY